MSLCYVSRLFLKTIKIRGHPCIARNRLLAQESLQGPSSFSPPPRARPGAATQPSRRLLGRERGRRGRSKREYNFQSFPTLFPSSLFPPRPTHAPKWSRLEPSFVTNAKFWGLILPLKLYFLFHLQALKALNVMCMKIQLSVGMICSCHTDFSVVLSFNMDVQSRCVHVVSQVVCGYKRREGERDIFSS